MEKTKEVVALQAEETSLISLQGGSGSLKKKLKEWTGRRWFSLECKGEFDLGERYAKEGKRGVGGDSSIILVLGARRKRKKS